jgi:UTP--glucose-1-phosphate uridylyltransferase
MPVKIRKAVIAVAGFGTRFLPATKVLPKELIPQHRRHRLRLGADHDRHRPAPGARQQTHPAFDQ